MWLRQQLKGEQIEIKERKIKKESRESWLYMETVRGEKREDE